MEENFKKYLVEFIGTFFLVFTVGSAIILGAESLISAFAIGFVLMIMVYAGGYVSGGHYNPAVSLAAVFAGALDKKELLPYWVSQIFGAMLASFFIFGLMNTAVDCTYLFPLPKIIVGEFLFTFALCYVVLQTAVAKGSAGNQYYGLAIGSTVTVGAFAVGGIVCYGAFNPAVALSMGVLNVHGWEGILATIFANLIGAFIAAYTYRIINK